MAHTPDERIIVTHVRGVHPSTGDPVARDLVIDSITDLVAVSQEYRLPAEATLMQTSLPYSGTGIVVAIPEYGQVLDPAFQTRQHITRWINRVASAVTATSLRPRAFGVWSQDGLLYLDVVEIFPSDQEDEAVAAGIARNQIAIWHAGRGEEIKTGGTGEL